MQELQHCIPADGPCLTFGINDVEVVCSGHDEYLHGLALEPCEAFPALWKLRGDLIVVASLHQDLWNPQGEKLSGIRGAVMIWNLRGRPSHQRFYGWAACRKVDESTEFEGKVEIDCASQSDDAF